MTATLINPSGEPVSDETLTFLQEHVERVSALVEYIRTWEEADPDQDAEARLWTFPRNVRSIKDARLTREDRRDIRVAFIGVSTGYGWDRTIWTDEEPHHNVGRTFVGSEEVEVD